MHMSFAVYSVNEVRKRVNKKEKPQNEVQSEVAIYKQRQNESFFHLIGNNDMRMHRFSAKNSYECIQIEPDLTDITNVTII